MKLYWVLARFDDGSEAFVEPKPNAIQQIQLTDQMPHPFVDINEAKTLLDRAKWSFNKAPQLRIVSQDVVVEEEFIWSSKDAN